MPIVIANVVFHAFQAPYLLVALAPVVVAVEAAVAWHFNRGASLRRLAVAVAAMNMVSAIVGVWLSPHLLVGSGLTDQNPSPDGFILLERGPDWGHLSRLAFLQAGVLSILIELPILAALRPWTGATRTIAPVILGNLASYAGLFAAFLAMTSGW